MSLSELQAIEELRQEVLAVNQMAAGALTPKQARFTGNLSNAGSATIAALDALGGSMKDIKVRVYISGAVAGPGITPGWFTTRPGDLVTFTEQIVPSLGGQHAPATAVIEMYEVGDLAEGLQGEIRIASAGNDSGLTFDAVVTYLGGA